MSLFATDDDDGGVVRRKPWGSVLEVPQVENKRFANNNSNSCPVASGFFGTPNFPQTMMRLQTQNTQEVDAQGKLPSLLLHLNRQGFALTSVPHLAETTKAFPVWS